MKTKIFGLTTAIALSMIAVGGLWAQSLPNNPGTINTRPGTPTAANPKPDPVPLYTGSSIFASPQSDSSQGRIRSNADDFIRPDAYTNVKFDKWFGMTSYASSGKATAGFATKIGGIYLGAFYNGNFWAGNPANNYTEEEIPNLRGFPQTFDVYYNEPSVAIGPVNNAALLIGVANMGIRLTYRTNYQSFNKSDIVLAEEITKPGTNPGDPPVVTYDHTFLKSYKAERGYIAPQIAWGMTKDLTKFGVKPYLTGDMDFHWDSEKGEVYINNQYQTSGEVALFSNNYIEPKIAVGLGGVTFFNKNGFRGSADLDYEIAFRVFDNEYSYHDILGKFQTAKIKGLSTLSITEDNTDPDNPVPIYTYGLTTNSYLRNVITPSVSGSWSSGNVGLRLKLNLPMTITGEEVTGMDLKTGTTNGTLVKDGNWTETSTFAFQPDLRLALSWRVVPKLALYLGGRLQTTALSLSTTDGKKYTQDVEDPFSTTKKKNNNFGGTFTHNLRLGTTFNISDNVWLEAQTGLWNSEGRASVFGTGSNGLFEFSSILVGLKF